MLCSMFSGRFDLNILFWCIIIETIKLLITFCLELKHEIDVWKKACSSLSGYSRDENSVRNVLKKKVMALENLLRKHLYDTKPDEDDFKANLAELQSKVRKI